MKPAFQPKELLRNMAWAGVLAAGITIYFRRVNGQGRVQDGLLMAGILFVCLGLFRLTRKLELYHSTIYGYHKLIGGLRRDKERLEELGSYGDYVEAHPYEKPYWELLLTGVGFLLVALLLRLLS